MQTPDRQLPLAASAIVGLAVVALWPVLSPGMSADDYVLQVFARFTRSPLTFLTEDHSSSYFYRPITMLLWWLVAKAGDGAVLQYGLNIALHALNAALVGALAWRWSGRWQAMLLAGVLFAVHPSITATPMWLADRFDLSATLGVLAALLLLERAIDCGRAGWLLPLAALWAIGSKEIGVIVAALAVLRLIAVPAQLASLNVRLRLAAAVISPVVLVLAVRSALLRGVDQTLGIADLTQAAVTGIGAWWARWPAALGMTGSGMTAGMVALLAGALLGWWLLARRGEQPDAVQQPPASPRRRGVAALLLVLGGLLVLPSLVQWPVTQLVLVTPAALDNPINLRFYYLAFVAVAIFVGIGVARLPAVVVWVASLAMVLAGLPAAREQARNWERMTAENDRPVAAALSLLAEETPPGGVCVVEFTGLDAWPGQAGFLDSAIKSALPATSPWLRCVFLTSQAPWLSVLPGPDCTDATMAPLRPRVSNVGKMPARRFGSLCIVYPQMPAMGEVDGLVRRWAWTGGRFKPMAE